MTTEPPEEPTSLAAAAGLPADIVPEGLPGIAPAAAQAQEERGPLGWLLHPTHAETARMSQIAGPVFLVCAVLLVPWTVYLLVTLPSRQVSHNYDLAWGGFDIGLVAALALTAWALVRLSRMLPVAAATLGGLLLVDAWFDVVTSRPGGDRALAVVMALVVELPLAAVAYWMAYHGQQLRERAIAVRLLRAVRRQGGRGGSSLRPGLRRRRG